MLEIADRLEPLRVLIDAEEVRGFAHAENELTKFLWDFRDASQKITALEKLKMRLRSWPKNDLSRFLLLRVDNKLLHLAEQAIRVRPQNSRAA
jgi:hypothetical protein